MTRKSKTLTKYVLPPVLYRNYHDEEQNELSRCKAIKNKICKEILIKFNKQINKNIMLIKNYTRISLLQNRLICENTNIDIFL